MTEGEIIALIGVVGMILVPIIQALISNRSVGKRLDKIERHNDEQYLSILRLTIMSEEMPVAERIIAGKKYTDKGGNGEVKAFYEKFVEEHTK